VARLHLEKNLLRMAAQREAADVAPAGADAQDGTSDADPLEAKLRDWQSRWSGIWSWFCGDRAHPSQSALLRQRARKAIPDLLATISVLQERRAGRSDRSADFRTLARWFAGAPSEHDTHRLWRAAFGLSPARHFTGEPPEDASTGESWLDAPPHVISARLRSTGRYERRGGPAKIRDRSAERRRLADQVTAEREQTDAARRRLATGHVARLSSLGELDHDEFSLFLRILGEALSAGPPGLDGVITTRTGDGTMEIVLRPLSDGVVAEIKTPDGVLRGPDHEITISDLTETCSCVAHGHRGCTPMSPASLPDVLDQQRDDDRRRCVRALLRHPLLTPGGPDQQAFVLARRHAAWLGDWFASQAGWTVYADHAVVRLKKIPGELSDASRGAAAKVPFGRRRYVLACLAWRHWSERKRR